MKLSLMKINRLTTLAVVMPLLLMVGCGSDTPTVTKPRTEAECNGLAERADAWFEGIPDFGEEDLEVVRRNVCKNAFAHDKGYKLTIEAAKCYLDLNGDTMSNKDKQILVNSIKITQQAIKDNKKYANQLATCPELGD